MTLFMVEQSDTSVVIFTDTLVTDANDDPKTYRSKVWTFPHLNMVMAVTGTANTGDWWSNRIGYIEGVRDIDDLNHVAPAELRRLYPQIAQYHGVDIGTSTVYTYGFPRDSDKIVGYIYRSNKDFEAERHETEGVPRFATRPPLEGLADFPTTREAIIDIAERIRAENGDGHDEGKVAIGGELFGTWLTDGCIHTELIHRFPETPTPASAEPPVEGASA